MKFPIILIDNGHGKETVGKRSPDGSLREWRWSRDIAGQLMQSLRLQGYDVFLITPEEVDVPLSTRAKRVNAYCNQYGKKNVLLISIHINASGNSSEWRSPQGWSAYTTKGETESDILAKYLYKAAKKAFAGRKIRKYNNDAEPDFEENFYILQKTACAAVLTENFFMDNEEDCAYLLSAEGKNAVVNAHLKGIIEYIESLS